jgi:Ca2+-binding EF-hand superfamily protein
MRSLGVELSADQTSKLLATYDTKRSGSIDFADFLAMVVQQAGVNISGASVRLLQQVFLKFDADSSGTQSSLSQMP